MLEINEKNYFHPLVITPFIHLINISEPSIINGLVTLFYSFLINYYILTHSCTDSFAQKYSLNSSYMLDPEDLTRGTAPIPKDSDSEADLDLKVTWEAC